MNAESEMVDKYFVASTSLEDGRSSRVGPGHLGNRDLEPALEVGQEVVISEQSSTGVRVELEMPLEAPLQREEGVNAAERLSAEQQAELNAYLAWSAERKREEQEQLAAHEEDQQFFRNSFGQRMALKREREAAALWEAEAKRSRKLAEEGQRLQAEMIARNKQQALCRKMESNRKKALEILRKKKVEEDALLMAAEIERLSQEAKGGD